MVAHQHLMNVLAISGSLRAQSTNTTLLRAAKLVAPPSVNIVLYKELETIIPFNPDLEGGPCPQSVLRLRGALRDADAVLLSTPEYAHGVPGVLKNALDWIVGSGELSRKPVALFNASTRGEYAQASLREILLTMGACLLPEADITVPLLGKSFDASEVASNPQFARLILAALEKMAGSTQGSARRT